MSLTHPEILQSEYKGFTIDHATLSQIVKTMAAIEKTNATICLDLEGLTYRKMDPCHVCLSDIRIPQMAFEKYEIRSETYATFDPKELKRILQTLDKKTAVKISLEEKKIKISQGSSSFEIAADYERPGDVPIPRLPYDAAITFKNAKQFKDILNQCDLVGDYVEIVTIASQTMFKALVNGEVKATITRLKQELSDLSCREDSTTTYSIEYLKAFLQTVPGTANLTLEYSERKPLRARTTLNGYGVIEYYLAPRVEA